MPRPDPIPRVVLIGLDGVPVDLVERGIRDGWLPSLSRLDREGTLRRLRDGAPDSAHAAALILGADPSNATGYVRRDAASASVLSDPDGFPSVLPMLESGVGRTLIDRAPSDSRVMVTRWPVGFPFSDAANLRATIGTSPSATFGDHGYTVVREGPGLARSQRVGPHVVIDGAATTGGASFDLFRVELSGPTLGGVATSTVIEARVTPARTRGELVSSEDRVSFTAGRWSEPLLVRFELAGLASMLARVRCYLKPSGLPRMELVLEPVDFDPTHPPPWMEVSRPPGFARELERLVGPLPNFAVFSPGDLRERGLLDERGVAAAVEADFEASRRLFEGVLARGEFELLVHWFDVAARCERLGQTRRRVMEEVELFGKRVESHAVDALLSAAAAELDEVIGGAIAAVTSGALGSSVTLLVVSSYPGAGNGFVAATRPTRATSVDLRDVAATVLDLLGANAGGVAGSPIRFADSIPAYYREERVDLLPTHVR